MISAFSNITPWLSLAILIAYVATIVSCIIVVLSENRNPIRGLTWVVALIFLPVVGLVFYLFFGRSLKGRHMLSRHNKRRIAAGARTTPVDLAATPLSPEARQLVKLAHSVGKANYTQNNEIEILADGKTKFDTLTEDLLSARYYIYLQYYIFADDEIGAQIAGILMQKAKDGVAVRVIYDHVGSISSRNKFFKKMRDAGVDAHPFFKVTFPQLANRINWRNHRKVVVIDDNVAYVGGMNIASRYLHSGPYPAAWRDLHFRLKGDIVAQVKAGFATDWSFMGQPLIHVPVLSAAPKPENTTGIQFLTSGPTSIWDNLSLCFLEAIASARKSIYIQTPYFLPTDSLLHALQAAALAKVDVRVMIPRRSDSILLQYATSSYVTQCLRAGIKVYLYNPGMLHSKAMIIDRDFTTVGSTNFDFRSFENNFECNLLVYDSDFNRRMRDIFFEDLSQCTKLTFTSWRQRPISRRLIESIVRLMAPVL